MEPMLPAVLRLDPGPLLVDARFRDFRLASRLLEWAPAARGFRIGSTRGVDAPADLACLGGLADDSQARSHVLVEAARDGWVVNLPPRMRPELWSDDAPVAVAPDAERIDLSPRAVLRIPCGGMTYELRASERPARLPRPLAGPAWRREAVYTAATALFLVVALAGVLSVPPDTKALSLDDVTASHIYARTLIRPPVTPPPPPEAGGGAGSPGASAPPGAAPSGPPRRAQGRPRAASGPVTAAQAADAIATHGILGLLRASSSSLVQSILKPGTIFDESAADVLAGLMGPDTTTSGIGPLVVHHPGNGPGGPLIGDGTLQTIGDRSGPRGDGYGGGPDIGRLHQKAIRSLPEVVIRDPTTRGSLDKDIVRRIVRRHLNEVRYCYEEELVRRPELAGRLVVQFAIAATGRVLSSVVQTSTLRDPRVESCVTAAVRRWEFPEPRGGGLVLVSYPFQLLPAGGGS